MKPSIGQAPAPTVTRVYETEHAVAVDYSLHSNLGSISSWVNVHDDSISKRMEVDFQLAHAEDVDLEAAGFLGNSFTSPFVTMKTSSRDLLGRKLGSTTFLSVSQAEDLYAALGHAIQEAAGQTKLEV